MASAEGLECPLCCELFDDQNICPRILSCGHTFCTGCLERLLPADDKIQCPTCRVEVNVPEAGVAGLPKNFALLNIINANVTPQNNGDESSYICEVCGDEHPASFCCLNCKKDFCKGVARFHASSRESSDHHVVSLEPRAVNNFCPDHKEPFHLFDKVCDHMVCKRCIKLNHSGHDCLSLADEASEARQEMQAHANKIISATTGQIKDAEAQVMKASLDIEKNCQEQGAIIQSVFKELHDAIAEREQVLMTELNQLQKGKTGILTGQQEQIRKFLEGIENSVQGVLFTIKSLGNAKLLDTRSVFESMLLDIEKQSMVLVPEAECVPEFLFDPRELQEALNKAGVVYDKSACAETTHVNGMGLTTAYLGEEASFVIIARDAQERKLELGGNFFKVELKNDFDERMVDANVKDFNNGNYLVTYTVPSDFNPGKYRLSVRLRGAHIKDSPFTVRVASSIGKAIDNVRRFLK